MKTRSIVVETYANEDGMKERATSRNNFHHEFLWSHATSCLYGSRLPSKYFPKKAENWTDDERTKGFHSHTIIEFISWAECATLAVRHTSLTQIADIITAIIMRVYEFFSSSRFIIKIENCFFPAIWFHVEEDATGTWTKRIPLICNGAWRDFAI